MLPLDLTDFDAAESKVETAIGFHGCIDVLVNNGGISSAGSVLDTLLDVYVKVMNVNYFGQVALTKGTLRFLCTIRFHSPNSRICHIETSKSDLQQSSANKFQ